MCTIDLFYLKLARDNIKLVRCIEKTSTIKKKCIHKNREFISTKRQLFSVSRFFSQNNYACNNYSNTIYKITNLEHNIFFSGFLKNTMVTIKSYLTYIYIRTLQCPSISHFLVSRDFIIKNPPCILLANSFNLNCKPGLFQFQSHKILYQQNQCNMAADGTSIHYHYYYFLQPAPEEV